jgi:DNA-binding LacI/PurR family transcriptional regulator
VDDRIVGYREALYAHGRELDRELVVRAEPGDAGALSGLVASKHVDALLCANDLTAAQVMRTLIGLALQIPEDVRIAGIDDVRYAELLPVPLTTFHQPCAAIGATAIATMLDRIENPDLPARSVLLNGSLVVRESCGAAKR